MMDAIIGTKNLLEKVKEIQKREKELSRLRGESFNIFRLLGMETDEPRLHTKFLFEMLNKDGTHGMGSVFFDGFINVLNKNIFSKEDPIPHYSHYQHINRELNVGGVDHSKIDGGIIDLHIETDSFSLAIENKIYSNLGYQQLERYRNYQANKTQKRSYLLLLTPDKYDDYEGQLEEGKDYFAITYKRTILEWLGFCHEKASNSPILRETIKQYIITIKGILGMLTNQEMNKELETLILKNYDAARQIAEVFTNAKELRTVRIYDLVLQKLSAKYPKTEWENELDIGTIDSTHYGFSIRHNSWPLGLKILFQGNPTLKKGMIPTILFNSVDQKTWNEISSIYPKNAKRWPPKYTSQIQFKGKFKFISNFIDSGNSIPGMADEIFDYVVEMVVKLQKEVKIVAQIINK